MRVLIRVAYDGTAYAGWQRQQNAVTVQERVEEALASLFPERPELTGGSRTDAGVHSYGNPAVFDVETRMQAESIAPALNVRLPEDIRILSSIRVRDDFHPHRVPSKKTYEYRIFHGRMMLPTMRNHYFPYRGELDIDAMRSAASCLIGTHDFTSFSSAHAQVKSRVRTIYELTVSESPVHGLETSRFLLPEEQAAGRWDGRESILSIRVTGDGFLYNMVRIIAGTLIETGRGKIPPEEISRILEAEDRSLAGPTAPAGGLYHLGTKFLIDNPRNP